MLFDFGNVRMLVAIFAFNLGIRTLPFAAYALACRRRGPCVRVGIGLVALCSLGLALTSSANPRALATSLIGACAYYCVAGLLLWALYRLDVAEAAGRASVAAACIALFLVVPAVLFRGPALIPVVVFGFDRALAAFSYLVSRGSESRTLGQTLFFILVDPNVVWHRRATLGSADKPGIAAFRCVQGLIALVLAQAIMFSKPAGFPPRLSAMFEHYGEFVWGICPWLLIQYLGVSGTASWQLGLLRGFGFSTGERYHYPFLARDPIDFWQRWNRYVNDWLMQYVFGPTADYVRLRWSNLPAVAWSLGVSAAFVVSGLLHLLATLLLHDRLELRVVTAFVAYSLVVIVFRVARRAAPTAVVRAVQPYRVALRPLEILATGHFILIYSWYLLPALAGM